MSINIQHYKIHHYIHYSVHTYILPSYSNASRPRLHNSILTYSHIHIYIILASAVRNLIIPTSFPSSATPSSSTTSASTASTTSTATTTTLTLMTLSHLLGTAVNDDLYTDILVKVYT